MLEALMERVAKGGTISRNLLFSGLVLAYMITFFYRVSASVVLPGLSVSWGMSATLTSLISSLYFYAYAVMQPISGVLNDRLGPSRVVSGGLLIGCIGSIMFGFAGSPLMLAAGRLLIGLGLAPMLSGSLVYSGTHFVKSEYSRNSGITFLMGNLGAVFAVSPLGWALDTWGRQSVFVAMATATACLSIVIISLSKADKLASEQRRKGLGLSEALSRIASSAKLIARSRPLSALSYIWAASLGPLLALQGLWAVAWCSSAYPGEQGLSRLWATMIGLGLMAGNAAGAMVRLGEAQRSRTIKALIVSLSLCWGLLVGGMAIGLPFILTAAINFLLGMLTGMCHPYMASLINEKAPAGWGGSVFGLTNMAAFALTIAAQTATGIIIDAVSGPGGYTPEAFTVAFALVGAVTASSILFIRRLDS